MAQTVREQHESDFPIFEYLDKVNPIRAINYWKEARRSTRWSLAAMLASFVLAGIIAFITQQGIAEIHESNLPKLSEALIAPYERESRPFPLFIPGNNIDLLLPETIGDFIRFVEQPVSDASITGEEVANNTTAANIQPVDDTLSNLEADTNQNIDTTRDDSIHIETATADETDNNGAAALVDAINGQADSENTLANPVETKPKQLPLPIIANPAANCLLGISTNPEGNSEDVCGFANTSQMATTANYHHDGRPVQLTVVRYEDEIAARQTVLALFRYNRQIGEIGNYAILNARPVDWYFSRDTNQFGFVWSNGAYIYAVHTSNFRDLEDFVEALRF